MRSVLFIGTIWPEPVSSAAGTRTLDLIRDFQSGGYAIHFASASRDNEFRQALEAQGVRTTSVQPNDPAFDAWIAQLRPTVVIFDRFMIEEQFGWRVEEFSPESLRVLDTIDLHSLRYARETRFRKTGKWDFQPFEPEQLESDESLREIAAILRSDLSLMISSFETEVLTKKIGLSEELLLTLGFSWDESMRGPKVAFAERRHFAMIGNFRHAPNADAVMWVKNEIWPAIRAQLPDAELHVYGAYPPKEAMAWDDPRSGFRMKGPCENAVETLARYRVNLAPLRFGAGLKGKILDGWSAGTPVVTTWVGAEGMRTARGFAGREVESAEDCVRSAVSIEQHEAEFSDLSEQGRAAARELFDREKNRARLLEEIERRVSRLQEFRGRNFLGRMLTHHQMKSLKYFSRWIEAKEQLSLEGKAALGSTPRLLRKPQ